MNIRCNTSRINCDISIYSSEASESGQTDEHLGTSETPALAD